MFVYICYLVEGGYTSRSNKEPVVLPTAPRAARGPRIDEENIPTNPPFVAYVTSLPYEVDEDDLIEFFAEMKVSRLCFNELSIFSLSLCVEYILIL